MPFVQWFVCALLLAGSTEASFAVAPNIILITLDTTRADRMGFLGSKRGLTPNLDKLARKSEIFTRAYAHVPLTTPSHATILTGTYPQFNHVSDLGAPLGGDLPYLPEILRQHGYHTAAFVGSQVLDPKGEGAPGFERGFDRYDAGFHSRRSGEDRYQSVERRAGTVVDHAAAWLGLHSRGPFFVWVQLYDPHDPYDPPDPFKAQYADAPYDGEIAYTDLAVGKLLAVLEARSLFDGAMIVVAADHGEAFGEHGERTHGVFLYDETIHVPLLIKLPKEQASTRVESRVGLVDIAPTVLAVARVPVPAEIQGSSLLYATRRKASADRAAEVPAERSSYAETDYPYRAFGWSPLRALRSGKYLYVQAPERELYDQSTDPGAVQNLATGSKAIADTLAGQLQRFRASTRSTRSQSAPGLRPEQAEQLHALGYITGDSKVNPGEDATGPDPKAQIEIANLMHEALLAAEEDRYSDVVAKLEPVLKAQPSSGLANLEMGRALNHLDRFAEALPWLRKAVEFSPASGKAHFELGSALVQTGDPVGATRELRAAMALAPDSEDAPFALAFAYEQEGNEVEAVTLYRATLRLNPDHFGANLMLGRLMAMQNQAEAALPYLRKAVGLEPGSADAHRFLANVYLELGQHENARRERAEADRLSRPEAHP